ncbi:MAG: histidine triad nucleotide-binding protein [Coriobacteriia bacterium]|nr:histidine triad nucleotide-binding protein [Coriobacteriia bacterium]
MHELTKDCIFCKIVRGEIPSKKVYENEYVLAFDDIAPQAPVHTLIVPKEHVVNLEDNPSPELLAHLFDAVHTVAEIKGVAESGYRVVQNNGKDAGQTVSHLHVHIFGGRSFGEGMV